MPGQDDTFETIRRAGERSGGKTGRLAAAAAEAAAREEREAFDLEGERLARLADTPEQAAAFARRAAELKEAGLLDAGTFDVESPRVVYTPPTVTDLDRAPLEVIRANVRGALVSSAAAVAGGAPGNLGPLTADVAALARAFRDLGGDLELGETVRAEELTREVAARRGVERTLRAITDRVDELLDAVRALPNGYLDPPVLEDVRAALEALYTARGTGAGA